MNTTAIIIFASLFILFHLISLIISIIRMFPKTNIYTMIFEALNPIIGIIGGILMIISQTISTSIDDIMLLYSLGYSVTFFFNGATIFWMCIKEVFIKVYSIPIKTYWRWILLGSCILNIILGILFSIIYH